VLNESERRLRAAARAAVRASTSDGKLAAAITEIRAQLTGGARRGIVFTEALATQEHVGRRLAEELTDLAETLVPVAGHADLDELLHVRFRDSAPEDAPPTIAVLSSRHGEGFNLPLGEFVIGWELP